MAVERGSIEIEPGEYVTVKLPGEFGRVYVSVERGALSVEVLKPWERPYEVYHRPLDMLPPIRTGD